MEVWFPGSLRQLWRAHKNDAEGHLYGDNQLAKKLSRVYTFIKGAAMPQAQLMTLHEKLQLGVKSIELEKQGKFEEAKRVSRQIPLAPHLAKFLKDHIGTEALLQAGWNLSEAEEEYGADWLSH